MGSPDTFDISTLSSVSTSTFSTPAVPSLQFGDLQPSEFGVDLAIIVNAGKRNAEDLHPGHPELPLLSD